MNWQFSFGTREVIIIIVFATLYLLFFLRVFRATKKLKLPLAPVFVKFFLRGIYFSLLIVALLGPSFGEEKREVKTIGKDIFICVDLSQSMDATDVAPSRLEKVKFELKNVVEAFHSDRIGVIIFSHEAFMQCPLTYDNSALLNIAIQPMNTGLVSSHGTDFGPPLEMALKKLTQDDTVKASSKAKTIILISDGEDFGDDTDNQTKSIESNGIRLFTLGIGTAGGSKIPTSRGYKRDRQGKEVVTRLNASSLKKLARETDGKYFEINESRNDVERLISAIRDVEGELRDHKKVDATKNRYYYFLGAALLLMVLDMLLGVRLIKL